MRFVKLFGLLFFSTTLLGQGMIPKPSTQQLLGGFIDLRSSGFIYMELPEGQGLSSAWENNTQWLGNFLPSYSARKKSYIVQLDYKKVSTQGAYTLIVDSVGIRISGDRHGIFYGIQSLGQLVFQSQRKLSYQMIDDEPQFPWRGIHLDVSRHFFSIDFIKKYIDLLALHKMNTFHWHLTDD